MQKFSPLMQEIQTKYADDKQRQAADKEHAGRGVAFDDIACDTDNNGDANEKFDKR